MSAKDYKKRLFEALLTLLWEQWTALGVPGQAAVKDTSVILDPEALLLFSAGFARYDQRLYDLILDWLRIHAAQINIQRLKALHGKAEWKDTASLGYMASIAAGADPVRWKKPAQDYTREKASRPAGLFKDEDDVPERFIPKQDELAKSCGFLRNCYRFSEKVPSVMNSGNASLLLRMRGLLGISARVETLLILLTSGPCKVQDIAARSGFIWKSIQDVLQDLAAAGYVGVLGGDKRGKQYFLKGPERFRQMFDLHEYAFPDWPRIYDTLGLLWRTVSNPNLAGVSGETFRNELQKFHADRLQEQLMTAGQASVLRKILPRT